MKTVQANFYFPASLCYGAVCNPVDIPWVRDFDVVEKGAEVCVLVSQLGKGFEPGLYVRPKVKAAWRLAMTYQDMCACLSTAAVLKIVLGATVAETLRPETILFKNATRQVDNTIYPGPNYIWAAVLPLGGASTTPAVSDKTFLQNVVNTTSAVVNHGLNKYVAVTVLDASGEQVTATVVENDLNTITVSFNPAFSGSIVCN